MGGVILIIRMPFPPLGGICDATEHSHILFFDIVPFAIQRLSTRRRRRTTVKRSVNNEWLQKINNTEVNGQHLF